ncbi:MAG: AI-2E family transporter [Tissierellia bacterium]|nr:AI-2E family transporter [Tissierellia bacterium]
MGLSQNKDMVIRDMNIQISFFNRGLILLVFIILILLIYYLIHIGNRFIDEDKRIKISRKRAIQLLIIALSVYILYFSIQRFEIISNLLFTVIISLIFSYLLNPIINYMEKRGLSRSLGIIILYVAILGIFAAISISFVPRLSRELKEVIVVLPDYFNRMTDFFKDLYDKYYNLDTIAPLLENFEGIVYDNLNKLQKVLLENMSKIFTSVGSLINRIISLVLIPILTFYFLKDKDKLLNRAYLTIPKRNRPEVKELLIEIDKSLSQFVRGRLILAIYVGIATTIVLLILNINFAVVIGLLTGIADIIPYFGPFLGFLPAVIFAFLDSVSKGIWVAIIFVLIQWVENNVLAPKIIGESTGLHPITVLLGIIIAGNLYGVLGMIFVIPLVSILKILIGFFLDKIRRKKLINK